MRILQISVHPHQHKNQCLSHFLELWFKGDSDGENPVARGLKFGIKPEVQLSLADIHHLVRTGLIYYNQKKVPHLPFKAKGKCKLIIAIPDIYLKKTSPQTLNQNNIVYEDEHLVLIDKPAGLPSQSTLNIFEDHALSQLMSYYIQKNKGLKAPYLNLMHRLDKDTSGLLMFSKKITANKNLTAVFESRSIKKTYLAIVNKTRNLESIGPLKPILTKSGSNTEIRFDFTIRTKEATSTKAIEPNNLHLLELGSQFKVIGLIKKKPQPKHSFYFEMDEKEGQKSETDFKVVNENKNHFLIECYPKTGRSHQLRVHLKSIGYPILGDVFYNPSSKEKRLMLHAWRLNFKHPLSQKALSLEALIPFEFKF